MASSSNNNFEEVDDESFDQYFDQTLENICMHHVDQEEARKRRKKRVYIERNREAGHQRLWNDYFSETPTYPPNLFRR